MNRGSSQLFHYGDLLVENDDKVCKSLYNFDVSLCQTEILQVGEETGYVRPDDAYCLPHLS